VPDQDEAQSGPLHKDSSLVHLQHAISAYDERADLGFSGFEDPEPRCWAATSAVMIIFGRDEAILSCRCSGCTVLV
jgi:hypothetical protein